MTNQDAVVTVGVVAMFVVTLRTLGTVYMQRAKGRAGTQQPAVQDERLQRAEQAVDAIAIEVERISEAQRFTARLLSERRQDPAPR